MTDQTNDTGLQAFIKFSRKLGEEQAEGDGALTNWYIGVSEASSNGYLSDAKDADGHTDLYRGYAEYIKGYSKKAKHEHTVSGIKVQLSKANQIKMASEKPTCDFYGATLPAVLKRHEEMRKEGVKVRASAPTLVEAARTQLAQDDDLTPEQIEAACRKPEAAEKTVAKELSAIVKRMENLISGENGIKFDDVEFVEAFEKARSAENNLTLTVRRQAALKEAIELGLVAPEMLMAAE
jgi:hypothetical protein